MSQMRWVIVAAALGRHLPRDIVGVIILRYWRMVKPIIGVMNRLGVLNSPYAAKPIGYVVMVANAAGIWELRANGEKRQWSKHRTRQLICGDQGMAATTAKGVRYWSGPRWLGYGDSPCDGEIRSDHYNLRRKATLCVINGKCCVFLRRKEGFAVVKLRCDMLDVSFGPQECEVMSEIPAVDNAEQVSLAISAIKEPAIDVKTCRGFAAVMTTCAIYSVVFLEAQETKWGRCATRRPHKFPIVRKLFEY